MPENCIIDYNTRFSGITETDLRVHGTTSLRDAQKDLMAIINADTILVGHGLEHDLRSLRIIHGTVIDTTHWSLVS
jgi:RNA exonuclease 1